MPDELRLADAPAGEQRIALVAGAGELQDPEPHRRHLVILDQGVREELLAEPVEVGAVLRLELDDPADADVGDALEPERRQRPLDCLALRVEDALLGADQHPRLHRAQIYSAPSTSRPPHEASEA